MRVKKWIIGVVLIVMVLTLFNEFRKKPDSEDPYDDALISKTEATTSDRDKYYLENQISVVSYNIRCSNDPDGNSIKERAPRLEEVIKKYDPDLIGFQEYVPDWEPYITSSLSDDYEYVLQYRSTDDLEGTPIFWKKSKFKMVDSGYFWLSETPEEPSKGWNSEYVRICMWVKLEVRQTGKEFYFFNTHFDFKQAAQVNSADLLIQKATNECDDAQVIVTADFNMKPNSMGYTTMSSYFTDVNMDTVKDSTGTAHGYGVKNSLIDYCFVNDHIRAVDYKVMDDKVEGMFVSDHYGIYSEIILLGD